MKRGKYHVLGNCAGVALHALQDAGVQGMQEVTVAQQKANHPGTATQNAAGMGKGAVPEFLHARQHPLPSRRADQPAAIEDTGDRRDPYACVGGDVTNGRRC
jgi:hypothetical protein